MKALIVTDMQNDFMPGGALGVPSANEILPMINALIVKFPLVVAVMDWHPFDHMSFVTSHPGKKIGDRIRVGDIDQILWPVHCVSHTYGSELAPLLDKENFECIFYKGTDKNIDSYSAFFDNARRKSTYLGDYLKQRGVSEIFLTGVATEYCILYSVMDAIDLGFRVYVIVDACRPINLNPRDEQHALEAMAAKGAEIILSSRLKLRSSDL
jgi:nicotinamidase/pyrazinamidase